MASTSEGRYPRFLRRALQWACCAGVLVAAAIGAMLLGEGQASAQPGSVPQIGLSAPAPVPDFPFFIDFQSLAGALGIEAPTPAPEMSPEQTPGSVAIDAARGKVGAGYSAGAAGPDAFDCSGLVQWSYGQAGVSLPRTSYEQLAAGTPVAESELQPGDLVSFYGGGHSALYAGDGTVIHASTSGTGVTTSSMSSMPYAGARRF